MRFENQTFTQDIAVDYNEFVNCTFRNCRIIFHGGEFSFSGTVHFEQVAFGLGYAASNTLTFMKFLRAAAPQAFAELMAAPTSRNAAAAGSAAQTAGSSAAAAVTPPSK
ncbi:MAG TPA: hypothetical protein VME21_13530 [Steroidobacteraceae bacterium]|nr:hypothetical protein [Steroidobacteraceae bacterium]